MIVSVGLLLLVALIARMGRLAGAVHAVAHDVVDARRVGAGAVGPPATGRLAPTSGRPLAVVHRLRRRARGQRLPHAVRKLFKSNS